MTHFLRPDRVYRTGVISPVAGFNPAVDVMGVAARFTNPYAGLGDVQLMGNLPLWDKLKLKIAAWRARRNFHPAAGSHPAAVMAATATPPPAGPIAAEAGFTPNGSASQMGPQFNSQATRIAIIQAMAQANMPSQWSPNAQAMIQSRWNGRWGR
jgi:hypothetical protein